MDSEITIIGAGVVGLAIGESLTEVFKDVFIVEKHNAFGQETSSRNSEVIHGGMYYPEGSLKAKLCVEGKSLLYDYCEKYHVPHKKCGKLIVATSEKEISVIENIMEKGRKNGISDLSMIGKEEIAEMEPNISAIKAVFSPSTGIVDTHSLMKQYETNTINNGGNIVYGSGVTGIKKIKGGYIITLSDLRGNKSSFTSRIVINSAGLTSDKISEMAGMEDERLRIMFCKGEYFRLKPPMNKLVNRLIYPVPHHNLEGIGIHVTVDMSGGVKLGPDVKYLESNIYDYSLTKSKQEAFFSSARKFLPFIQFDDIAPEMAGIRPKIQKPGQEVQDFYIREESEKGCRGFINLIGIESPGLTSSLAIGKFVRNIVFSIDQ
jgi:L-2-hydroxyglutarate oxidase LhgO